MPRTIITSKDNLIEIGNNIRKWRVIKGIKQEVLADALEISKVSISKIETGKTDIPLNRLFQIASILGISIEKIFQDPSVFLFTPNEQIQTIKQLK